MEEKKRLNVFDDNDIEKQWDEMYERGRVLRAKYPDMKMPDFLISDSENKEESDKETKNNTTL